jgi:hypothetical protein
MQRNSILYSGVWFAALDGTAPSQTSVGCQRSFLRIPTDWVLAPSNSLSQSVIRAYPWGTYLVVLADGNAYGSSIVSFGLSLSSVLFTDGAGGYIPGYCDLRILIQCGESWFFLLDQALVINVNNCFWYHYGSGMPSMYTRILLKQRG